MFNLSSSTMLLVDVSLAAGPKNIRNVYWIHDCHTCESRLASHFPAEFQAALTGGTSIKQRHQSVQQPIPDIKRRQQADVQATTNIKQCSP